MQYETLEQKKAWARRQLFALAGISEQEERSAHQYGLCEETRELIIATADESAGIAYINQFVPDYVFDDGDENA